MMKRFIFLMMPLLALSPVCAAQLNVALLHQLIGQSQAEHGRQDEAKNKQVLVTAEEQNNRAAIGRLQSMYRTVIGRFGTLSLAISAVQIGLQAEPVISDIVQQQAIILRQAGSDPALLSLAYGTQADLADQAHQLSNYLYGLLLSAGDLNQMRAGDRSLLFAHVLSALRSMAGASRGLALTMQYAARRKRLAAESPFSAYFNTDKQLIDAILRDAVTIKHY